MIYIYIIMVIYIRIQEKRINLILGHNMMFAARRYLLEFEKKMIKGGGG